jgi:hypothetical protein
MLLLRATRGDKVGSCGIGMELACRRSADTVPDACICTFVYSALGAHVNTHTCMAAHCRLEHAFIQNRPFNVALQQSQDLVVRVWHVSRMCGTTVPNGPMLQLCVIKVQDERSAAEQAFVAAQPGEDPMRGLPRRYVSACMSAAGANATVAGGDMRQWPLLLAQLGHIRGFLSSQCTALQQQSYVAIKAGGTTSCMLSRACSGPLSTRAGAH